MLLKQCSDMLGTAAAGLAFRHGHCRHLATTPLQLHRQSPESSVQPILTGFHQTEPEIVHPYKTDYLLQTILKCSMPREVFDDIKSDMVRFGQRIVDEVQALHTQCEMEKPYLIQYDAFGRRIDKLQTSAAWKSQKKISAEEGLIAIGYERCYAEYSRLYQMAKLYLYSPSSGLYGCPLAMTDGAAKSIEVAGTPNYLKNAYEHLTSRNPHKFWTSGQWMTEKKGGSDVAGGTETLAYRQSDGSYKLHGYKWFSSATDADMSLTLARVVDTDGRVTQGTKGLSMFYVETHRSDGQLNSIQMVRLKDKLGTRQLPTAELLLHGTKAMLVGEPGRGVATISDMLTISRTYNSLFSASLIRRMVSLCTDYSLKRQAFGKAICRHPLHIKTLAEMELEAITSTLLVFDLSRLLGLEECGKATDQDRLLLRLLTPISKLYTAKQVVSCMSDGLEAVGGLGYLEDTGLPSMYRDAQVLPIWEGTTNILSLDVLRAVQKSRGEVLKAFLAQCQQVITECEPSSVSSLDAALRQLSKHFNEAQLAPDWLEERRARELAYSLARVYSGCLLASLAVKNPDVPPIQTALRRWSSQDLLPMLSQIREEPDVTESAGSDHQLVMYGREQQ